MLQGNIVGLSLSLGLLEKSFSRRQIVFGQADAHHESVAQ